MASRFQQQSVVRKFIYFGLIVVLFTVALLHRKLVVNAQAEQLQLRDVDRGEVELTDAAIYRSLTGMRGLVVTSLWLAAIEKQKKHQWSEMEVLVRSVTKLQPHFISPWLFQSWNMAFNVSVECDRTRDKYLYISRGIELLAEGERKNKGNEHPDPNLRTPANPEMRYYIGFTYQLKVGLGDEKRTLRSLLDMSCIDPNKRSPDRFWKASAAGGREVNLAEFRKFCEENPRLVRRLREQLGHGQPRDIVNFLGDNRELPSRFEKPTSQTADVQLKPPREQFPILPPRDGPDSQGNTWPNPELKDFGGLDVDVFEITRCWYEYAQKPLPPSTGQMLVEPAREPPTRYRLPKMNQYIFRTYPARAQSYVAETLNEEGWFAGEGWTVQGWFREDEDVVVGKGDKYHAGKAWDKAYRMWLDYGKQNALYLTPAQRKKLEEERDQRGEKSRAAEKLAWLGSYLHVTNYDAQLAQADAERHPNTLAARRKLFRADRLRRADDIGALEQYEEGLRDWIDVALEFPLFGAQSDIQEDTYEMQLMYLRLVQRQREAELEPIALNTAAMAWPQQAYLWRGGFLGLREKATPFSEALIDFSRQNSIRVRIVPIRKVAGPLDMTFIYKGKRPEQAKAVNALSLWLAQAVQPPLVQAALPLPLRGLLLPAGDPLRAKAERRLLTTVASRGNPPGLDWAPLMQDEYIQAVRDRLGLNPVVAPPSDGPEGTPAGAPPGQPRQ